ncbi:MAG TPA: hypothetical protein VLE21_03625, partial [Candidatus Nitrosocosmicus sp.]|nr:hypothetical protein [Candidatus Nitrosocosmicus sp.]
MIKQKSDDYCLISTLTRIVLINESFVRFLNENKFCQYFSYLFVIGFIAAINNDRIHDTLYVPIY